MIAILAKRPYRWRLARRCAECRRPVRSARRKTCSARCQYRLFARGAAQERARRRSVAA